MLPGSRLKGAHVETYFEIRRWFVCDEAIEVGICTGDLPCDEPRGGAQEAIFLDDEERQALCEEAGGGEGGMADS